MPYWFVTVPPVLEELAASGSLWFIKVHNIIFVSLLHIKASSTSSFKLCLIVSLLWMLYRKPSRQLHLMHMCEACSCCITAPKTANKSSLWTFVWDSELVYLPHVNCFLLLIWVGSGAKCWYSQLLNTFLCIDFINAFSDFSTITVVSNILFIFLSCSAASCLCNSYFWIFLLSILISNNIIPNKEGYRLEILNVICKSACLNTHRIIRRPCNGKYHQRCQIMLLGVHRLLNWEFCLELVVSHELWDYFLCPVFPSREVCMFFCVILGFLPVFSRPLSRSVGQGSCEIGSHAVG